MNIVLVDRRDGTYFLDTNHEEISNVDDYRDRNDERGNNISSFLDRMMNGEKVNFTIKSKRSGRILYNYSVPSNAYGPWTTSISARKVNAFEPALFIRNLFFMFTASELVIFVICCLWILKKSHEESNKLIKSIVSSYNIAYTVNIENGTFHQLRMDEDMIGSDRSFADFTEALNFFINLLPLSDRKRMQNELDFKTICHKLEKTSSYNVEYRVPINKAIIWHEMNVTRIDSENIAIGFAEKDMEITQKHLENQRYNEYFALYEVDIDSGMMKVIKDSPFYAIEKPGTSLPYVSVICQFASTLDSEYCDFFTRLSDMNYVMELFETENKLTYAYRSNNVGKKYWVDCTCYVTLRHEDNTPAMFSLGFSLMDRYGILRQELQKRQKEDIYLLEEARKAAEDANKAKTDFLFNMSHDIRTPMNAITGFTNMAIRHIDDREKVLDCLEKTQKAGSMLLSLINSVLEVSRIESGNIVMETRPADVYHSFVNLEHTMMELASSKDIDLAFEFGNISDRFVYVDLSRCTGIFVNITSNAIKYTPSGGRVRVRCEQTGKTEDGYGLYLYTFEDNGIGMSEEFQKHIFEQFSRENTATVSGIQGTGLGMSIVKSYVELMGGTVSVKSKKGEGSLFSIILPFKIQHGMIYTDPVTGTVVDCSKDRKSDDAVDFTGKKVLLVEDNELNREIACEILKEKGLLPDYADDGTTAVEKVREKGLYTMILF